ncbi:MAG: hypothetical protein ACI4O7_03805 [Aristaeellaceae bacterium]
MEKLKVQPWQVVVVILLLVFAILSLAVFSKPLSSPGTYRETIQVLDNQKMKAAALTVTVTAASAAISALPDDTCSSIGDELDDLAAPLFLISCMLVLEKFMLTTFGWLSFAFLIPAACLIGAVYTIWPQEQLFSWVKRLLVLALALTMLVPASAAITSMVEQTYSDSVMQTYDDAQQLWEKTLEGVDSGNAFLDFFSNIANGASALIETAKQMLGILIDAVAVLLITSCAIPILTFFVFYKVAGYAFKANIPVQQINSLVSSLPHRSRRQRGRSVDASEAIPADDNRPRLP